MAKIDRTDQEKTFNIFGKKVKFGTICLWGLIIVLAGSSLGYLAERGNPGQQQTDTDKLKVQLTITFDENNSITKVIDAGKGTNALLAFKEIANITTEDTAAGKFASFVEYKNLSKIKTSEYGWQFYANGGINLKGLDSYTVSDRDSLELKYIQSFE